MSEKKDLKELIKAIETEDEDALRFLTKNKNPYGIRDTFENRLGQFVNENYEIPDSSDYKKLFKNEKLIVPKVEVMKNLPGLFGEYDYTDQNSPIIRLNSLLNKDDPNQYTGTLLHEIGHHNDLLKGYEPGEIKLSKPGRKNVEQLGLDAAEEYFKGPHKEGLFGLEALKDLIKGNKIRSMAHIASPLLKAAGIGAAGMGLASIGNKVMAGDLKGAGKESLGMAGDMIVPDLLQSEEVNPNEDAIMENLKKEGEIKNRRFGKLKSILENR